MTLLGGEFPPRVRALLRASGAPGTERHGGATAAGCCFEPAHVLAAPPRGASRVPEQPALICLEEVEATKRTEQLAGVATQQEAQPWRALLSRSTPGRVLRSRQ